MNVLKVEPALVVGAVQAILALVVAFGFHLTPEQVGGILAATTAILSVVVRQAVTPNERVVVAAKRDDVI